MTKRLSCSLLIVLASACSSGSSTPAPGASGAPTAPGYTAPSACTVAFSGDVTDTASLAAGCGKLALKADGPSAGHWVLSMQAHTSMMALFQATIDLGAEPAVTTRTSESVSAWGVLAFAKGDSNCSYGAASDSLPTGAFVLTLEAVEIADGAETGVAHGNLEVQMLVHAPPDTDCGTSDVERVVVTF